MATTSALRRVAAALVLVALLGACGGDDGGGDVSPEKFRADYLEASGGLRKDIANCVVDELLATLDQEALNDFYGEEGSALSPANQEAQDAAVKRCTQEAIADQVPTTAPPTSTTG
jgi:hypothetical protein